MNRASNTALIWAIALVYCLTLAAATAIYIALPDRDNTLPLIMALIVLPTPVIGTLATLAKVSKASDQVEQLTNGLMDSKVRASVADVLPDRFIDPAITEQLVVDRAARDAAAPPQP